MSIRQNECPEVGACQSFLAGGLSEEERSVAELHLVRCPRCREQLLALHDETEESHAGKTAPAWLKRRVSRVPLSSQPFIPRLVGGLRQYAAIAFAAVLLLAVGASSLVYWGRHPQPVVAPTTPGTRVRQSAGTNPELGLISPATGDVLDNGQIVFSWAEAPGVTRYEFTLMDEKGDILAQERVAANQLAVNTQTLKLVAHKRYFWTVTAKLPNGNTLESQVAGFSLR